MSSPTRSKSEAWLRYSDDLGLGPFYLDRASQSTPEVAAPPDSSDAPSFAERSERAPEESSRVSAPDHSSPALSAAAPRRAPEPPPVNKPTAPPTFIPAAPAPSLFESADRIEGDTLDRIRVDIGPNCTRCELHKARTNIVFGVGNPKAQLVFVGEGPGRDEDEQGEPFVGRAGKLLTQMIEAMGLRRQDVYICNVVKCRPPENRLPEKDEIATCSPYLFRQIDVIKPKVVCCLGTCAAQTLLNTNQGISRYRGEFFDYRGAKLIATYHPAYLLRNPNAKGDVWKDLQKVMTLLGLQPKRR